MAPEDGVVCAALGLGPCGGGGRQRPALQSAAARKLQQFGTIDDWLKGSQREFLAVDISQADAYPQASETYNVASLDLADAERHGTSRPSAARTCRRIRPSSTASAGRARAW